KLPPSGNFDALFTNGGEPLHYILKYANSTVEQEELTEGSTPRLTRSQGSYGKIFIKEVGKLIRFDVGASEVAAFAKRDDFQNPLFEWATAIRYFEFGKTLGHEKLRFPGNAPELTLDEKDTTQAVAIYSKGLRVHGQKYTEAIRADMAALSYEVEELVLRQPV